MQKCLASRKAKYEKQPYTRSTKEWYIWRYGDEEGLEKFNSFAAKSAHTEQNFIRIHGETKGKKKYKETIAKKNTVALTREQHGDDAEAIIKERYSKQQATMDAKSQQEKDDIKDRRVNSMRPYWASIKGRKKIDVMIEKYGDEEGHRRYASMLEKQFNSISRATAPVMRILSEIENNVSSELFDELMYGNNDKKEFFLYNKEYKEFYSYDIASRHHKVILEYDGAFWHPSFMEARIKPDLAHEITGKTNKEKFEYDKRKLNFARSKGFSVLVTRSDSSSEEWIVSKFIRIIKGEE